MRITRTHKRTAFSGLALALGLAGCSCPDLAADHASQIRRGFDRYRAATVARVPADASPDHARARIESVAALASALDAHLAELERLTR